VAVQLRGVAFVREGCLDCAQSKCDQCAWSFATVWDKPMQDAGCEKAVDAGAAEPPPAMNLSQEALDSLIKERHALVDAVRRIEQSLAVYCEQIAEQTIRRKALAEKADQLKRDIEWGGKLKRPPIILDPGAMRGDVRDAAGDVMRHDPGKSFV
jgi:hypothetical protein